ncbi:hypothetical protein ACP70R_033980 [Stipagrostis hirtigluma subsp. patula]
MKSGSGGASAPSAGGNSLTIAERQKPAPSCVAALFQMLAKRKLFSSSSKKSKMLPPVRAPKFSPGRPPVGGEKMPAAKMRPLLLDSAEYSRCKSEANGNSHLPPPGEDQNCSEMCTPGVVARLMGLSSMPAASHQRPTKGTDSNLGDHRNAGAQDWYGTSRSIYTSPQKQRKTGQLVDGQRGNACQFSASDTRPLWPQRRAHKVASPVRSPRSMSSRNKARLIEAAAKVLEPGLQSRNRRLARRHAYLEYSCDSDVGRDAGTVLRKFSGQFSTDMCDVDAPRSGAYNIGVNSLHNSTSSQFTEEDSKKSIPVRMSEQNVSCHVQPEGNGQRLFVSSSEKAGFGDSVQKTSNCNAATSQDVRKTELRSISRGTVPCSPLKQNNLKQNALPVACKVVDPGYVVQRHKHRSGEQNTENKAKDFVSLNKSMNSSTCLRSKRKVMDKSGVSHSSAENKNKSTNSRRTNGLNTNSFNKPKPMTAGPKATEKDMMIAKGAGLVSEKPKPGNPSCARSDVRRQVVSHDVSRCDNNPDIISFTFSSPKKVLPSSLPVDNSTRIGSAVLGSPTGKRHSRRDCQNTSSQRETVYREVLQGTLNLKTAGSVSFNLFELENRDIPVGKASSSLLNKKSDVPVISSSDELLWQCNSVDSVIYGFRYPHKPVQLHDTRRKCALMQEVSHPSPFISRGSNQRDPTSVCQSTYADDGHIFGGPFSTAESAFVDSQPIESCCTPPPSSMQDAITETNSRCAEPKFGKCGIQPFEQTVQDSKQMHTGEVTSTVELLLTNVRSSNRYKSKEPFKTFLLQTIESALATLTTSEKQDLSTIKATLSTSEKQDFSTIKATEASALENLALDFVMELLDSMCIQLCNSGYRSFSKLALICTEERLDAEVKKEIARCSAMAGRALDDLAVDDVEQTVEAGMNPMVEASQIGAQIEEELIQELVNEIGIGMLKRLWLHRL